MNLPAIGIRPKMPSGAFKASEEWRT